MDIEKEEYFNENPDIEVKKNIQKNLKILKIKIQIQI